MFNKLKLQVQKRFKEISSDTIFYVDIDRDKIWERYLSGFDDPAERQAHNCNCCKSFLRQYSGMVAIVDNKVQTIWDITPPSHFAKSVKNIRDYILSLPVTNVFITTEDKLGTEKSADKKRDIVWTHFYIEVPQSAIYKGSETIDSVQGSSRDSKAVLKRSLDELTKDAVDTVLELIAQGSLYRGNEFKGLLTEFQYLQLAYSKVPAGLKDNFCWAASRNAGQALTRIRNTAIGTLLINLSEGMELDMAVTKFETVMAPSNYKRPVALVTPRMVEEAKEKLSALGYLESLERRFAMPADLNVNNVLFVDKSSSLKDVFEDIKKDTMINPRSLSKTEEMSIRDFITDVLPKTKGLYLLLENSHLSNMVSLLTSVNGGPTLFKWGNPFSWAYTGGITDSIKERVKQAGGKVDGELRCSLSWHNFDDLDLHILEPGGNRIYYSSKSNYYTDGTLDVDMNAGSGKTREPVENIVWPDAKKMEEGRYQLLVHNFAKRETTGKGFTVQIECRDEIFELDFPTNPRDGVFQGIVQFDYTRKGGLKMVGDIKSNVSSKDKWNLKTNRFHKVKNMLLSPNCWGDLATGNKHYFFNLENCLSDEATRPFFNEFLKPELETHRKFFEVLGGKLTISPTNNMVAGVGFSETQRNHIYVKVDGSFKRTLKINF